MATHQSTTIPRAHGIRRAAAATRRIHPARRSTRLTPGAEGRRSTRGENTAAIVARRRRLHTFTPELQSHALGHFNDALGFIETARTALETNEKAAFATATLTHGIDMLRHIYNVLDATEPAMSPNAGPAHRRKQRRASPPAKNLA